MTGSNAHAQRHLGPQVVIKPLGPGHFTTEDGTGAVAYATAVDLQDPDFLDLGPTPFLIQEQIPAQTHQRVVTVNDCCWVAELNADGRPMDWRGGFGLPDPDALVGIAMRFQIAQKLHAVSDPHDPPAAINDRPRDVVDLLLLRDLAAQTGSPTLDEVRTAGTAVFEARADEATQLGFPSRAWPPVVVAHSHWTEDFKRAAESAGVTLSLDDAVAEVNAWIAEVANSRE